MREGTTEDPTIPPCEAVSGSKRPHKFKAHNRISKSSHGPESLQVALLTLYKKDMIVVLRAMAEKSHIPTSYETQTTNPGISSDSPFRTSTALGNKLLPGWDEEVKLYDSLPPSTKKLTTDLKEQLRAIYATDGELAVTVPVVQRQKEGSDCGVFAIAYLLHFALGDKPEELIFDQAKMRGHLAVCFKHRSVLPFPNTPKRSRTSKHIIRV